MFFFLSPLARAICVGMDPTAAFGAMGTKCTCRLEALTNRLQSRNSYVFFEQIARVTST